MKQYMPLVALILLSASLVEALRQKGKPNSGHVDLAAASSNSSSHVDVSNACGCNGNAFPLGCGENYSATGFRQHQVIFPGTSVPDATAGWDFGKHWYMSVEATSTETGPRTFGFPAADGAFLEITIPPGVANKKIYTMGVVKDRFSKYAYRSAPGQAHPPVIEGITFTNICLRPLRCHEYICSKPHLMTLKSNAPALLGFDDRTCCDVSMCGTVQCLPATRWADAPDKANLIGADVEACCSPVRCSATPNLCNSATHPATKYGYKTGDPQGNTAAECCSPRRCSLHTCSSQTQYTLTTDRTALGSTDAECCIGRPCSNYTCPSGLGPRARANGSTQAECCEEQFCTQFNCGSAELWAPMTTVPSEWAALRGWTHEQCCRKRVCSNFTCPSGKVLIAGAGNRQGSTEAKCCVDQYCKDFRCQAGYGLKPIYNATNGLLIRGSSHAACCQQVPCATHTCAPLTQWNPGTTDQEYGVTNAECCQPRSCASWICKSRTKWAKRNDTASRRWLGSTDEECCEPKRCVSFETRFPTQWKRKVWKDGKVDSKLQGSTEEECYDPIYCSSYRCKGAGLHIIVGASNLLGSTDEECCTDQQVR
eukprot:TRINITY_DN40769_c0_g1_i1.p1 TRINITY_DN40769_c0_g1~~TRINITY_DN40769_c0_g1_i1.p1  ORF type:complete len:595 (+),score=60.04 TRINITY_DN40769_c0_g1_i1:54-1838(+)